MGFSAREKNIWIELIVSILVAVYYFSHAYAVGGFSIVANTELGKIIVNAIMLSIVSSIILTIIFRPKNQETKDERDILIDAKSNSLAYHSLCLFCVLIIGSILINEGIGYFKIDQSQTLNVALLMNYILIALMISDAVKSISQIFYYRRGY